LQPVEDSRNSNSAYRRRQGNFGGLACKHSQHDLFQNEQVATFILCKGKNLRATIKMAIFSRPRRLPTPAKPPTPPKPSAPKPPIAKPPAPKPPAPKPKPTAPAVPDPTKPRTSGFSPAGLTTLAGAGAGLLPFLAGANPLRLAGGLSDALGLDELAGNVTDFLGDITGFNYLKENPLVAVGLTGVVGFVGLKFLRVI
jgi:hypothetical protein